MTITVNGPDGSTFQFPDDTPQETVTSMLSQHYGGMPSAGPTPSGQDVSAIAAAQALPGIGAYAPQAAGYIRHLVKGGTTAENTAQILADIEDYRKNYPKTSTFGDIAIGCCCR